MPTASIVKGRGYLNHNDRTIKQVNSRSWKPELSNQNIVYVNEPIQNVYHELFDSALDEYQNKSKNPDIYTQLFQDNTSLNKSYPDIEQEFSNLPDVDELIEISELDRENEC